MYAVKVFTRAILHTSRRDCTGDITQRQIASKGAICSEDISMSEFARAVAVLYMRNVFKLLVYLFLSCSGLMNDSAATNVGIVIVRGMFSRTMSFMISMGTTSSAWVRTCSVENTIGAQKAINKASINAILGLLNLRNVSDMDCVTRNFAFSIKVVAYVAGRQCCNRLQMNRRQIFWHNCNTSTSAPVMLLISKNSRVVMASIRSMAIESVSIVFTFLSVE